METESVTANSDRTIGGTAAGIAHTEGITFVLAAVTFFVGSGVLTRSGEPGASTPVPWMLSHVLWIVATAFVAIGTVRLVHSSPALRTSVASYLAGGLGGLGVLHTLQWTTWVYVDVSAYRQGAHGLLSESILHPFGTGHMLVFALLVGSAITALAWAIRGADLTHRVIPWLGIAIGVMAVLAGAVSLLTFAPVRSPASLAAIGLQAASFAWLFVLGVSLVRGRPTTGRGNPT